MENNKGAKAKNFLQKMYNFRVKVDRKGKPIVNVSSIFGLACLLFAPHMTIAGVVLSLVLGYQIHFESEDDNGEIEERIRKAAENVRTGVTGAAKSIQKEINRMTAEKQPAQQPAREPEKAAQPVPSNEELLNDLQAKAEETAGSNPFSGSGAFIRRFDPVHRMIGQDAGEQDVPFFDSAMAGE